MKSLMFTILIFMSIITTKAQQQADSLQVHAAIEEIFTVCNSAEPEGENAESVIFERLSMYILYTGTELPRKNKTACDYNKSEDRKIVDNVGMKIKTWLDKIENYKLIKYIHQKEGAADKHILQFSYKLGTAKKEIEFHFVKIKDSFLLTEMI